jgi:hypothetical protein
MSACELDYAWKKLGNRVCWWVDFYMNDDISVDS